jgi:hypothetical protein
MTNQLLRGGEFIISESDIDQVFIPEDMDEEQIMVKDMVDKIKLSTRKN